MVNFPTVWKKVGGNLHQDVMFGLKSESDLCDAALVNLTEEERKILRRGLEEALISSSRTEAIAALWQLAGSDLVFLGNNDVEQFVALLVQKIAAKTN